MGYGTEILAGAAIASLLYGGYAGERQASAQRDSRRDQEQAQAQAEDAAISEARVGQEEERRARSRAPAPDLEVLLGDQRPRPNGASMDAGRLLLGRPGLLGL